MVENNHMYDFGSSTNYTILDFCQALWGKDIYTTAQILAQDFNINIDEQNKLSKEDIKRIKARQQQQLQEKEKSNEWFRRAFVSLTNLNRYIEKIIKNSNIDTLNPQICMLQNKLNRILAEDLDNQSISFMTSSKEELYKRYKDLDFGKEDKLLNNIDIIFDDMVRQDFNIQAETEDEDVI